MDRKINKDAPWLSGKDCGLDKWTVCETRDCRTCGWNAAEAKRRKRLPLHRNGKGLWEKHVGKRG